MAPDKHVVENQRIHPELEHLIDNPYLPPNSIEAPRRHGRPVAQHALLGLLLGTCIFALINAIDQELPNLALTLGVTFFPGVSQVPGLLLAYYGPQRKGFVRQILLACAFLIAGTGLSAYALYAFNGPADSLNSAAHMHVIVFPLLHCAFAVLTYFLAGLLIGGCLLVRRVVDHFVPPP